MFVGRVIVGNGVEELACGHRTLNGFEEADELLMAVLGNAAAQHRAVANIEGGEQGADTVAFVIVVMVPRLTGLSGSPGWVRSSAWPWPRLLHNSM